MYVHIVSDTNCIVYMCVQYIVGERILMEILYMTVYYFSILYTLLLIAGAVLCLYNIYLHCMVFCM